ncbi:uncharacterized protein I206_105032 [Kwoniella pini CBS 10737]|uniref:POT family proton-dependent oligopeptide transporter n=1 Tax=Kwoniella pini CBS 10737 TaxID=1296096 RepID=A0A1B9I8K5_9TREE|nr:uncharacterized protein I206_02572 [Kwoniella pini CBS 10737]OCF51856.1 hypothetical protein I206_02572 [Kwoniella pini CBS 10737]
MVTSPSTISAWLFNFFNEGRSQQGSGVGPGYELVASSELRENDEQCGRGPVPTSAQLSTLRHSPGQVPWAAYAIALVELAERASYYGVGGLFPNFVQRPLPPGGSGTGAPPPNTQLTPGALGMGLQVSTALSVIFSLLAYTMPLLGGILSDLKWGKFKTIAVGTGIAGVAHILFVYAAVPSLLHNGGAFIPFLIGLILLGGSAGLIKANIAPLMAEQYLPPSDYLSSLSNGEKVIVDREATIQKIMSVYYGSINIGGFIAITSTFAEKYVGFWLAFLMPGVIFLIMPFVLNHVYPKLVKSSNPNSSVLLETYHQARSYFSSGEHTKVNDIELDSNETDQANEFENILGACKFFAFFIIYNIADGGLNALLISQAGSMTTNGIPNDFLSHANPLIIVISIPLLNRYLYPYLSSNRIKLGPVRRVIVGFILSTLGMLWASIIQYLVYQTSPCGYNATTCEEVSPISAWLVLPAFLLSGLSESFAVVSAMEIGYMMSPPSLRSIINSIFLFMQALSAIVILIFLPIMKDPYLIWPFAISTIITLIATLGVWKLFSHLDDRH